MSVFGALDVSATGMTAQQLRIVEKMANHIRGRQFFLRRKVIRVLVKVLAWQTVIILEKVLRQVK